MNMLNIQVDPRKVPDVAFERSPGYWQTVARRLLRDKVAMGAALVVLGLLVLAVFGPMLAPADPYKASMLSRLKPIGFAGHALGTDAQGSDRLSRTMVGTRLSLFRGITPVGCACVLGPVKGFVWGFAGWGARWSVGAGGAGTLVD